MYYFDRSVSISINCNGYISRFCMYDPRPLYKPLKDDGYCGFIVIRKTELVRPAASSTSDFSLITYFSDS